MNTENSEIETTTPDNSDTENATNGPEMDSSPDTQGNPEPAEKNSKPRRGGSWLAFFAFLFSVAALAGTGWMWWQDMASEGQEEDRVFTEIARLESSDSELSLKLNQIRDQVDTLAAGDVGAEFAAMQARLEADRAQMAAVDKSTREQMALSRSLQAATESMQGRLLAAEAALSGMSTRELDAGGELDLAEVDYLLRLANERLKLFSDPAAADQARAVADMHLEALDNPMYLGVRQEIAAARRSLSEIEIPDYLAIAGTLDSIQAAIPSLSFPGEQDAASEADPVDEAGWWDKLKSVFSNLVTVRRSTEAESERISLEDKDYVRQRVWLQLEIAHLSLMRRDQEAFRNSLLRVKESLSDWFDAGDSAFQAVGQEIDELLEIEISLEVPDITGPWSTLRMLRSGQPRPMPEDVQE